MGEGELEGGRQQCASGAVSVPRRHHFNRTLRSNLRQFLLSQTKGNKLTPPKLKKMTRLTEHRKGSGERQLDTSRCIKIGTTFLLPSFPGAHLNALLIPLVITILLIAIPHVALPLTERARQCTRQIARSSRVVGYDSPCACSKDSSSGHCGGGSSVRRRRRWRRWNVRGSGRRRGGGRLELVQTGALDGGEEVCAGGSNLRQV